MHPRPVEGLHGRRYRRQWNFQSDGKKTFSCLLLDLFQNDHPACETRMEFGETPGLF